ncbi:hypothetical protein NECAME_16025 [Necator americanus]|uniref:Uncharacterized protein n=1 Tax=Necator americanus TaxID=51031 RepID=W2TZ72_NECAM|nr:hypothetical protein NECAME_16025 [Necator americanus]ETN86974.1 hypothetical protein NECAME_16025 [Necator americanus]
MATRTIVYACFAYIPWFFSISITVHMAGEGCLTRTNPYTLTFTYGCRIFSGRDRNPEIDLEREVVFDQFPPFPHNQTPNKKKEEGDFSGQQSLRVLLKSAQFWRLGM